MNNSLFPCLWYDGDAKSSADFYCETFGGKSTADSRVVINIELFGQKFMLLNGGAQFMKNASISFMVICETEQEVEKYWTKLSENGIVLIPLEAYPWSKKYGWVRDKFGVTWQISLTEKHSAQKIIPTLMFLHENNGKAEHAIDFYTTTFPNSKICSILKYGGGIGDKTQEIPGNIQHAHFSINGYSLFCMDSSHAHSFDFNEAISLVVLTENQEETDYYWDQLTSDGGRESMCGWLKDKFGVSWQIVPKKLLELMNGNEPEKSQKVMQALMTMQKIDSNELEKAYNS